MKNLSEKNKNRIRKVLSIILSFSYPGLGNILNGQIIYGATLMVAINLVFLIFKFDAISFIQVISWSETINLVGLISLFKKQVPLKRPGKHWAVIIISLLILNAGIYHLAFKKSIEGGFGFQNVHEITTCHMAPTLIPGSYIAVRPLRKGEKVKRGQIVYYRLKTDYYGRGKPGMRISRVVGLPREEIKINGKDLYINSRLVSRTFARPEQFKYLKGTRCGDVSPDSFWAQDLDGVKFNIIYDFENSFKDRFKDRFKERLGKDQYFVQSDNRWGSMDSNYEKNAKIEEKDILGVVVVVVNLQEGLPFFNELK